MSENTLVDQLQHQRRLHKLLGSIKLASSNVTGCVGEAQTDKDLGHGVVGQGSTKMMGMSDI